MISSYCDARGVFYDDGRSNNQGFGDYARIGAPISALVLLVGTPLIVWAWG